MITSLVTPFSLIANRRHPVCVYIVSLYSAHVYKLVLQ